MMHVVQQPSAARLVSVANLVFTPSTPSTPRTPAAHAAHGPAAGATGGLS